MKNNGIPRGVPHIRKKKRKSFSPALRGDILSKARIFRKYRRTKESQLNSTILTLLQIAENQGKLIFQRNNTGGFWRTDKYGTEHFYRFGRTGSSDWLVWIGKRSLFLEVKTLKGKVAKKQLEYRERVLDQGLEWYKITDSKQVESLIRGEEL